MYDCERVPSLDHPARSGSATVHSDERRALLHEALEHAAHHLPAQGPIGVFIHHNTLHAFQHLPFERAVAQASELFGAEAYLPEARYRAELRAGRITEADLAIELDRELHARDPEALLFGGRITRAELWRRVMIHGVDEDAGSSLRWRIEEQGMLRRLLDGIPIAARRAVVASTSAWLRPVMDAGDLAELGGFLVGERDVRRASERMAKQLQVPLTLRALEDILVRSPEGPSATALWTACRRRVDELPRLEPANDSPVMRRRDHLLRATGEDTDLLVDAAMIELTEAFLDQGVAYWPMPFRELGLLEGMRRLMQQPMGTPAPWLRPLGKLLREQAAREQSAEDVAIDMLVRLGAAPDDWAAYVERTLLALPGWAGLVRQLERAPELAPHHAPPCSLLEFLAVRLIYEYLAATWVACQHLGHDGPLSALPVGGSFGALHFKRDHVYRLFQVCQLTGVAAPELLALPTSEVAAVMAELDTFTPIERRRLWHLAYERRHRNEILTAVAAHRSGVDVTCRPSQPRAQFVFCIDDREESMRRAIEEHGAAYETFGTGGFFGFAMYYWGVDDAHAAALCPVVDRPQHRVTEVPIAGDASMARGRQMRRKLWSHVARYMFVSSRSLVRGWLATLGLGLFSLAPLLARVLFPRRAARLRTRLRDAWFPTPRTKLMMTRDAESRGQLSQALDVAVEDMIARVARVLEDIGLTRGFAPLVVVLGHGSTSLNNPHESAYDCGACGGRRGGPNARIFAHAANRPDVRAGLRARGIEIPDRTWFVGGYHDTCSDAVELYDLDALPLELTDELGDVRRMLDRARAMNAHERCRRFEAISPTARPEQALRHVEDRAEHLAEPRPEYGHSSNAVCVFGRRALTRGLFFDRRAFLASYDPTIDDDDVILTRVLAALAPVGAGINLEYFFSTVDNERYGCGTKLPHNLTGLVGVINGPASDLRTGLTLQMVEIHEPVRLLVLVEATPAALLRVAERAPLVGQLVINRWIQLVSVDPHDGTMQVFDNGAFVRFTPERTPLPEVYASAHWYVGYTGHLPVARVRSAMTSATPGAA